MVEKCTHCIIHRKSPNREPIISSPLPSRPWERIAADFCDFKGANYLVVVDYYSRYIEIIQMKSTSTSATTKCLMMLYARHGLPSEIVTDNGPQFRSEEFKAFNAKYDIIHTTSSPLYPQSNGEAERAVQTAKTLLCQEDVLLALLTYRSTPLPAVGFSPAQLLMGRQIRNTLPTLSQNLQPRWPPEDVVRQRESKEKERSGRYFNSKHGTRPLPGLSRGQSVWIPDRGESGIVVEPHTTPRSWVIQVGDKTLRRNRRDLRVIPDLPASVSTGTPEVSNPVVPPSPVSSPAVFPPVSSVPIGGPEVPNPVVPPVLSNPAVPEPVTSVCDPRSMGFTTTSSGRRVRPPKKLNL